MHAHVRTRAHTQKTWKETKEGKSHFLYQHVHLPEDS